MAVVPNGTILIWPSTNASIPAGFTRYTALDGRFPKGAPAATAGGTNAGASTHTHSSPVHTHSLVAHNHTGVTSTVGRTGDNTSNTSDPQILLNDHYHAYTIGGINGGNITDAAAYAAASNNPPYYEVIFIQAVGAQPIPNGAITWWATATVPTGFTFCDGSGTTPDLRNKYLLGAATSGDSGGSGGSLTNTHDISHSHTAQSHTHVGTSGNVNDNTARDRQVSANHTCVAKNHTHTITLNPGIQYVNDYSGSLVTAETVEPVYKKLIPIKNTSGSSKNWLGIILLWEGSLATIPAGCVLCDGNNGTPDMRDFYPKSANTTGELGNSGGANTHAHAAQSHSHTSNGSHTHVGGTVSAHDGLDERLGNSAAVASPSNNHSVSTCDTVAATYGSANTTGDTAANEPLNRTMNFIQVQKVFGGAGLLAAYLK